MLTNLYWQELFYEHINLSGLYIYLFGFSRQVLVRKLRKVKISVGHEHWGKSQLKVLKIWSKTLAIGVTWCFRNKRTIFCTLLCAKRIFCPNMEQIYPTPTMSTVFGGSVIPFYIRALLSDFLKCKKFCGLGSPLWILWDSLFSSHRSARLISDIQANFLDLHNWEISIQVSKIWDLWMMNTTNIYF